MSAPPPPAAAHLSPATGGGVHRCPLEISISLKWLPAAQSPDTEAQKSLLAPKSSGS